MYGTDTEPWRLEGDAPFYQDALGSDFGGQINPLFLHPSQHRIRHVVDHWCRSLAMLMV